MCVETPRRIRVSPSGDVIWPRYGYAERIALSRICVVCDYDKLDGQRASSGWDEHILSLLANTAGAPLLTRFNRAYGMDK